MWIDKQMEGQTEGWTNGWTDKRTNIYSIFRDKLSLPEGSSDWRAWFAPIYATGGEVPETIMKGGTADIKQICEFAWYNWVMFCDTVNTITFPSEKLTLGRYLGPATDIGLALTAKILKQNGKYISCLTLFVTWPQRRLSALSKLQPDCISTK